MQPEVTENTLVLTVRHANPKNWLPLVGCLVPFVALPLFAYGVFQHAPLARNLGALLLLALLALPLHDHVANGITTFTFNRHRPVALVEITRYLNRSLHELNLSESRILYIEQPLSKTTRKLTLTLTGDHLPVVVYNTESEGTDPDPTVQQIIRLLRTHVPHLNVQYQPSSQQEP